MQSLENEGILYVFLVFQTEEAGQKDGGDSQTQLCGVALENGGIAALITGLHRRTSLSGTRSEAKPIS